MAKVSGKLRSVEGGLGHWCPGCEEMHVIPTDRANGRGWAFDGNLACPTFSPSARIAAAWEEGPTCCHYFLKAGRLQFCADSTHALAGKTVDLPDLPE